MDELRAILESGPLFWFREDRAVARFGCLHGVARESASYVGMGGRSLTKAGITKGRRDTAKIGGLRQGLTSHAAGRRSGDQFCLYVADRLVLPTLAAARIG
jgi:hypothetical protein